MPDENKRLAILDELDKFNTAPPADSLMLGILQEEEAGQHSRFSAGQEPEPQPEPAPEPDEPKQLSNDHYLPLNTSIQDLNSRIDNRISSLERSIQTLASTFSQQSQQRQQAPQEQYDPDMPITAQHMQALAHRQDLTHQMSLNAYKQNLSTRAHLEYQRFQSKNPDFQFNPQELDFAIDQMARDGKLDQLAGTNWSGHFEQMYAPQRQTRYDAQAKEVERLTNELNALKKTAVRNAPPPQPVSPSTGRATRGPAAIATPLEGSNDDAILGLKSFRQKGNFKGFGKDLKSMMKGA